MAIKNKKSRCEKHLPESIINKLDIMVAEIEKVETVLGFPKYYEAVGDRAAAEEINLSQLKINRLD